MHLASFAVSLLGAIVCLLSVVSTMTVRKKPAAAPRTTAAYLQDEENKKAYIFPGHQCGNCKSKLYSKTHEPPVECTIVGSETFDVAHSYRKECKEERCHVNSYRVNFAYVDSVKVNTMTFKELETLGVYMVTNGFGFTMKYLQLSYYRLLRGNLAPGQEASVRSMLDTSNKCISLRMFRSHLLRALEGYALAMRTPNEIVPFPVDDPTSHLDFTSAPMTFEPSVKVRVLSFDGHFGLHRPLNPGWGEKDRSVRVKGRPRKKYNKDQRSCTCADKSRQRVTMKNRTAGWQFVIDPQSRQVLAAKEHEVNECLPDKVAVVEAAMKLKKVKADAIIHDDACHFEAHVHRHQGIKKRFRTIKHFIVDEFHRCNHKCKKCKLTPSEKRRFKGVRTNMSEVFNSWVRRKNFMYNSMRPSSHKFWVHEAILFWNKHLREMPTYSVRRSTAVTRKRPAARQ